MFYMEYIVHGSKFKVTINIYDVLSSQVTSRLLEADRRKLCVLHHELQVHACRATHRTVRTTHVNPALWTTLKLFQGLLYRATVLFSSQSNSVLIMSLSMQSYHLKHGLPLRLLYSLFILSTCSAHFILLFTNLPIIHFCTHSSSLRSSCFL